LKQHGRTSVKLPQHWGRSTTKRTTEHKIKVPKDPQCLRGRNRKLPKKNERPFLWPDPPRKNRGETGGLVQDGDGDCSREGSMSLTTSITSLAEQPLTTTSMRLMLAELADNFQLL
ncbi:Hypothetical predicted protein, partial [Pelobates cultripes]